MQECNKCKNYEPSTRINFEGDLRLAWKMSPRESGTGPDYKHVQANYVCSLLAIVLQ